MWPAEKILLEGTAELKPRVNSTRLPLWSFSRVFSQYILSAVV